MKSPIQLLANADIDHLEAVATTYSSQIGMRLSSLSINSRNLFPRLHEVLYTHFKNVQNFTIHSRLSAQLDAGAYVYSLPERASQVMWTARCLAASAKRWPQHADFDLEDLRGLFERGQELGGSIGQVTTWAEVVSALETLEPTTAPAALTGLASEASTPPTDVFDWKSKLRQVKRIEAAARRHYSSPSKGPRDAAALVIGLVVLVLGLIVAKGLAALGFTPTWPWLGAVLPLFAALGTYVAVLVCGPGPRSYSDVLYASLAAYAPVDKDAYRVLQAKTRNHFELEYFQSWAWSERQAIADAAGLMKAKKAFLGKVV